MQPIVLQIGAFLRWDSIPLDTKLFDAKAKLKIALTALRKCRKNAWTTRLKPLLKPNTRLPRRC